MPGSYLIRLGLAGLVGLAGVGFALPAQADGYHPIECGGVVFGARQLDQDLACKTDPALTVLGDLDLNGFTVKCLLRETAQQEGVVLVGHGAVLRNGTVEGCYRSVVLGGRGGHVVAQVTANGTNRGISVESRGNRVAGNSASSRDNDAIRVEGAGNFVSQNTITSAGGDGINVRGRRNVLTNNEVRNVGEEGFDIRERFNEIVSNFVSNSGDDGVQVRTGDNRIANNLILNSKGRGILIGGFESEPVGSNDIIGNHVAYGEQEGINVDQGFERQRIFNNVSVNNQLDDLRDQNPDCDDNLWVDNVFDTAEPADCID
jgi:parallel beta-helix repeat protein